MIYTLFSGGEGLENYGSYCKLFVEYLQIEKNASPYTVEYYQADLETFRLFLKREEIHKLENVDQRVVRVFLTDLYDKQLSRKSVSRTISCLRSFYKFLEREQIIIQNPFVQIKLPKATKPIPDFLYEEELVKLFEINDLSDPLGQRNQAIIETLYATGIRVGECQGLLLEDIDFSVGSMFIRGKGRKERYVIFGEFAKEALHTYLNNGRRNLIKNKQSTNVVFLNSRGTPLTTRGIRHILTAMVEKAALTVQVHPHKLRHTFATHMLNEGADLRTVQELLGHENLSSTQIYTHVTKDHLRSIYMNSHPRANI